MTRCHHCLPPIQAQRSKALAEKIPFHDKLADLGAKLGGLGVAVRLNFKTFVVEDRRRLLDSLSFPLRDLVRMQLVPSYQFRDRPLILQESPAQPSL